MEKKCSKCKQIFDESNFEKDNHIKSGLASQCRSCKKLYMKDFYQKNKNKYYQDYRQKNREKILKMGKEWRDRNKLKCSVYSKDYHEIHPQYHKKYNNSIKAWVVRSFCGHKKRGFVVDISVNDLIERAENTNECPRCGVKFDWKNGRHLKNWQMPCIACLTHNQTLTLENIEIICKKCNTQQNNDSLEEFFSYCRQFINLYKEHPLIKK